MRLQFYCAWLLWQKSRWVSDIQLEPLNALLCKSSHGKGARVDIVVMEACVSTDPSGFTSHLRRGPELPPRRVWRQVLARKQRQ